MSSDHAARAHAEATISLPGAAPSTETQGFSGPAASASAELPSVGEYELLEELGRGGMGIVYKARQKGVNRLVALKMILAGSLANEGDLVRFRREAEALGRLRHPNIVQVHEVGEHSGLPFFSLEYCDAGSLAAFLGGTPVPPAEAAALLEPLAQAVQAAHAAGVIHRDLKPGNVLLASRTWEGEAPAEPHARGSAGASPSQAPLAGHVPKITDFGLARKLDEASGQTHSGAVVGTPSYMAPEQAAGRVREVGPLADVYALGAILYECLTGRPPFRGASVHETLLQVLSDEPVPPSLLAPRVPRDLETVCLKCLRKEPGARYGSARALAEDLARFREGKPVVARPVGRLERAWRWCRRNPAVASLSAIVVVVLLAASVVSTYFAIDADQKRQRAAEAEGNEKVTNTQLRTTQKGLQQSNTELTQAKTTLEQTVGQLRSSEKNLRDSRDEAERIVAGSWLRPLGPGTGLNATLTDPEVGTFWELIDRGGERLWFRFVEEGLRSPEALRKLQLRARPALHAAVGLDGNRRARVDRLLLESLQDAGRGEGQRVQVAWLAVDLGDLSPETAELASTVFKRALVATRLRDFQSSRQLIQGLVLASTRVPAKVAVALLVEALQSPMGQHYRDPLADCLAQHLTRLETATAVEIVNQALKKSHQLGSLPAVAQVLVELSARLETPEAVAFLTQALSRAGGSEVGRILAQGLTATAGRLEPAAAITALNQAMVQVAGFKTLFQQSSSPAILAELARGVRTVAARMGPADALRAHRDAAAVLSRAMNRFTKPDEVGRLTEALAAVSARLDPGEAASHHRLAAESLVRALIAWQQATYPDALGQLVPALVAVADRLAPAEAARMAEGLRGILDSAPGEDSYQLWELARAVPALTGRLDRADAGRLQLSAANFLTRAMRKVTDSSGLRELTQGLAGLIPHLEHADRTRFLALASRTLTQAMTTATDTQLMVEPLAGLAALAPLLEPTDATRSAAALRAALAGTGDPELVGDLCHGLLLIARRLEPKDASLTATALTQAIARTQDFRTLNELVRGLPAVTDRLEPTEAAQVYQRALSAVLRALHDPSFPTPSGLQPMTDSLKFLASRLDANEIATKLRQALSKAPNPINVGQLAEALIVVADHLDAREAANIHQEAATALAAAMVEWSASHPQLGFVRSLESVAPRLGPEQAARVAASLSQALTRTTWAGTRLQLAEGLAVIADRLDPVEAARRRTEALSALTRVLSRSIALKELTLLAASLATISAHLTPAEAAPYLYYTATVFTRAMRKTNDPEIMRDLANGLAVVLARLNPADALGAETALRQAAGNAGAPVVLRELAQSLSATADAASDASQLHANAAAVYLLGMATAQAQSRQVNNFWVALTGTGPAEMSHDVARSVAVFPGPGLLVRPVFLAPVLRVPDSRLSTQQLVDLLKRPLCVGLARRLVLDLLGKRYQRPFADQWEFIRFAQQLPEKLDFLGLPRNPDRVLLVKPSPPRR